MEREEIIIRGRTLYPGKAEGEALVSKGPMMGWGNVKADAGYTVERGHPLCETPFKDKILVLPYVRGSGGFMSYGASRMYGSNPAALLISQPMSISILTAMILKQPAMTDFEQDPSKLTDTGDYVYVNADEGYICIVKGRSE